MNSPPQRTGSPTALIATVLFLTIGMVALAGWFLWLGSDSPYSTAEVRFIRAVFAVAVMLPFLVPPVALLARRVHFGLVTALTTAAVYVVGVGWIAVVLAVLSGFSSGRSQRIAALIPAAAVLLQVVIFIAALMALRRLPASQRRPGVVRYGVGIPVLLAVGGLVAVMGAQQLAARYTDQMVTNQVAARRALETIHSCTTAFASGSAGGLPPDLGALGPSGTKCLDADLATGHSPGYRIVYQAGVPDAGGATHVYTACAQPTTPTRSVWPTLVVDDDGAIQAVFPSDMSPHPPADLALPCPGAWGLHPQALAKTIKHCALAFAARHREVGYPVSLGQLAKDDQACPHDEGHEHDWALKVWSAVYLSAPPGADGVIRGYRLYLTKYQLRGRAVVDETGAFLNHDDPDAFDVLARRDRLRAPEGEAGTVKILGVKLPPGYRAPEPRPNASANAEEPDLPDNAEPEAYQDACAKGDATACYTAGKAYQRRAARGTKGRDALEDLRNAALAYEKACEGQMARSCDKIGHATLDGLWLAQDLPKALEWITKSCGLGYAPACSRLGEIYESGRRGKRKVEVTIATSPRSRSASTITTEVDDPKAPGIPKDLGRAMSAYSRACEIGEREACLIAARLTRDDPSDATGGQKAFAQFAGLCEGGEGAACEAAAAMAAGGVSGNERSEAEWRRMACVFGQTKACSPGK